MHHEILIVDVQRHTESLPLDGTLERGGHVEVQGIPELVGLARSVGLDPGREVGRFVRAETRASDRREKALECPVTEEVGALLGQVEFHMLGRIFGFVDLAHSGDVLDRTGQGRCAMLERQITLLDHTLDQIVQEVGDLLLNRLVSLALAPQLLHHFLCELTALDERLQEGVLQSVHRTRVLESRPSPEGVVIGSPREASVHEKIREGFHEALEVHGVEPAASIFGVGRKLHNGAGRWVDLTSPYQV